MKIFSNKISGVTNLEGREEIVSLIQYVRANYIKRVVCVEISRAQKRHFCARVTEDAYGDVGLEVVNVGLGKRKARRFWVCALLLIVLLFGAPLYLECLPTTCWPGNEEPGNESRGTKSRRVYRLQRLRKCWCIVVSWLSSGWKAVTSWLPCCAATIFPSTVASTFTPSPTSLM